MQVKSYFNGMFEHYFVKNPPLLSNNSLFDQALWPLAIGFALAFLSIGLGSVTLFNVSLPVLFFVSGIIGFGVFVVGHFILVVIGSFYKYGVFKTIGLSILGVVSLIALALGIGFALYGGIFISAAIFIFLLPVNTVLVPLNILGFIGGSIWWYTKGLQIVDGDETPRSVLEPEAEFIKEKLSAN